VVAASQQLRDSAGMEHCCGHGDGSRQAVAEAVIFCNTAVNTWWP
jgi:hypothetical protein